MKYIFLNLYQFIRRERLIFGLIVCSVISSSMVLHFAYGLYKNYQLKEEYKLYGQKELVIDLQDDFEYVPVDNSEGAGNLIASGEEGDYVTVKMIKNFARQCKGELNNSLEYIEAVAVVDELPVKCDFGIKNGKIVNSSFYEKMLGESTSITKGRYFSHDEYRKGKAVALCFDLFTWNTEGSAVTKSIMKGKDSLILQGKTYRIVGCQIDSIDEPIVPLTSLEQNTPFHDQITIKLKKPVDVLLYRFMEKKVSASFGDKASLRMYEIPSDDAVYLYGSIIFVAFLIAVIAGINVSVLYYYVLQNRRKELMVFQICGMTRRKCAIICYGECMFLVIPLYIVCTMIYQKFVLPWLAQRYVYMGNNYGLTVYLALFSIFFLTCTVIYFGMLRFFIGRKKILQLGGEV